jgi:D-inositol-3-phosphate glycosyltransferase
MLRVAMISVHTCPLARLGSRETGGMNVYVRELSRQLGRHGVAVDVFTRRQEPGVEQVVEFGENARVIHLDAGPSRTIDKYDVLRYLPQFLEGVRDFRRRTGSSYHLAHSHYWLSSPVATSLASEWQVPLVVMFHTLGRMKNRVSRDGSERENAQRIEIERHSMLAADLVVAASPSDMEQMVSFYGALRSRIRVVPGGVDTSVFRPFPMEAARALLGLGPGKLVLFVGRIQQLKGIDLLLRAFAQLMAAWPDGDLPRLVVVGGRNPADGADPEALEMERLRILARELGVQDRVTFQGAVPHSLLPTYYSAADLVVVPSLYESFGLVALEAMACGAPVVASRVGGLQWTVQDGRSGFLVRRRDPRLFAAAMRLVLEDEALRTSLSREAVQVASGFSWASAAERTLQLYGELAPTPSGCAASG